MPDYADPVDAATSRFVPGANAVVNSTDVLHDPNYLIATAQNPNHRVAQAAILRLHDLYRQQELGQRNQALAQRYDSLQQRLALRDEALQQNDIHFQANQSRLQAHDLASEAYHQLSTDRDTEIDQQGHGLMNSMLQLDGALRRGEISKNDYDEGLLQAGQQFPLGIRHPEAAKHFNFAIEEADKQNAYNIRRQATQAAKLGAKYGIEPQVDPDTGLPSVEHTQLAALQTPKGRNEALGQMNKEMALKYGVTTGVGSLFNPIAPHVGTDEAGNQVDADKATHVAIPFLQTTGAEAGKVGKLPVPVPLFNQMKSDFNDRYFALNPQSAAQPAGAVSNTGGQTAPAAIPQIGSAGEYQALPAGSTFISNGKQYQKPAEQQHPAVSLNQDQLIKVGVQPAEQAQ